MVSCLLFENPQKSEGKSFLHIPIEQKHSRSQNNPHGLLIVGTTSINSFID
jgi:hypothetical protein